MTPSFLFLLQSNISSLSISTFISGDSSMHLKSVLISSLLNPDWDILQAALKVIIFLSSIRPIWSAISSGNLMILLYLLNVAVDIPSLRAITSLVFIRFVFFSNFCLPSVFCSDFSSNFCLLFTNSPSFFLFRFFSSKSVLFPCCEHSFMIPL